MGPLLTGWALVTCSKAMNIRRFYKSWSGFEKAKSQNILLESPKLVQLPIQACHKFFRNSQNHLVSYPQAVATLDSGTTCFKYRHVFRIALEFQMFFFCHCSIVQIVHHTEQNCGVVCVLETPWGSKPLIFCTWVSQKMNWKSKACLLNCEYTLNSTILSCHSNEII